MSRGAPAGGQPREGRGGRGQETGASWFLVTHTGGIAALLEVPLTGFEPGR